MTINAAAITLDAGLAAALRAIAGARADHLGWAARPKAVALTTVATLASLRLIDTLAQASGAPLLRLTDAGKQKLAEAGRSR